MKSVLPPGLTIYQGNPTPVSCVPGTLTCVAIVNNKNGGYGDVVTTNGGHHWTGYTSLPASIVQYSGISCPTTSTCWATGQGDSGQAAVAESTDGGQRWTDVSSPQWGNYVTSNGIDCVTANTCWVVGASWDTNFVFESPWAVETSDGGATWTTFTNLPAIAQYGPNGTYALDSISCTSAQSCVAAGGLNLSDGIAQVISTADGGTTWSLSSDPAVTKAQSLFSVSCLPGAGGTPLCTAVGFSQGANAGIYGPIALTSTDGGATWSYVNTFDTTGWMSSVSCADAQHCWAAGAGTAVSMVGTADGWATWSKFTAETTNEDGFVSCASVSFCVSTADNDIWFTFTDGGLNPEP